MSKTQEALKLALEALGLGDDASLAERDQAITALREALAEPDYKALYEKAAQQYNELAALMAEQPAQQQPDEFPLRGILASELKCWHRLTEDEAKNLVAFVQNMPSKPAQQQEPVKLRRGDILRCIETDELCTVWSTSTTGRTLIKWSEGSFGNYTAEQIGDLFWLEPEPDDLELAAEKSDNYAAFHAGYRFAVAHSLAEQPAQQQEPVAWRDHVEQRLLTWRQSFVNKSGDQLALEDFMDKQSLDDLIDFVCNEYTSPPASKPLTDEMVIAAARMLSDRQAAACNVDCGDMWKMHGNDFIDDARAAIEAAHGKGDA